MPDVSEVATLAGQLLPLTPRGPAPRPPSLQLGATASEPGPAGLHHVLSSMQGSASMLCVLRVNGESRCPVGPKAQHTAHSSAAHA